MSVSSPKDDNRISALVGTSSSDGKTPVLPWVDPTTHRLLVDLNLSGATIAALLNIDTFTSTNNQTTFNSSTTINKIVFFSVNGSIQTPSTNYTNTASAAVLNDPIPSGCDVILAYF